MIGLNLTLQKYQSNRTKVLKVMSAADGSVAVGHDATTENLRSSGLLRCSCNMQKHGTSVKELAMPADIKPITKNTHPISNCAEILAERFVER